MKLKEKIVAIQNELRIGKDGKNSFANYSYFQPDSILNMLNPLFLKHKVFSKFNLHLKDAYYEGELILSDAETQESETYIFDILKATVKGANEAQNSGATLTYAKRYSLMNAFNIAENNADFDSDAMAKKQEAGEQAEKQAEILSELSIRVSEFSTAEEFKEKGAAIREEFMSKGLTKQQVDSIMAKAFKRLK